MRRATATRKNRWLNSLPRVTIPLSARSVTNRGSRCDVLQDKSCCFSFAPFFVPLMERTEVIEQMYITLYLLKNIIMQRIR